MSEYTQFAGVMVLFIAILIGSYYFVLASPSARERAAIRGGGARGSLRTGVRDGEA